MSASQEFLQAGLPLATTVSTTHVAALVGVAAGLYNIKKITPYLHTTINAGEVGVPFSRGEPIERRNLSADEIEQIDQGLSDKSRFVIKPPGFYLIPPFRSIERVYVADNQNDITFTTESQDGDQLSVPVQITWNVSPFGDNPVNALTRVRHIKENKKESNDKEKEKDVKRDMLEEQVLSICKGGLGRIVNGRSAEDLQQNFNKDPMNVTQQMQTECAQRLGYYGVVLSYADPMPVHRTGEEVSKQGLEAIASSVEKLAEVIELRPEAIKEFMKNAGFNGHENGHSNGHNGHSEPIPFPGQASVSK